MIVIVPHKGSEGDEVVVLVDVVHDLRLEENLPEGEIRLKLPFNLSTIVSFIIVIIATIIILIMITWAASSMIS